MPLMNSTPVPDKNPHIAPFPSSPYFEQSGRNSPNDQYGGPVDMSYERSPLLSRPRSQSPAVARQAHGIDEENNLSDWQVFAHLFKATVGTGVLSMPSAVKNAGVLVGTLCIFLVAMVIVHAMQLLVRTAQFLRRYYALSTDASYELDYAETVRQTIRFGFGPESALRHLAAYLQFCLIASQLGFLAVYVIFVSETTKTMVDSFDLGYKPPLVIYEGGVWLLFIPLVFVKTLNRLAFLSGLANLLGIVALAIVIIYCILDLQPVDSYALVKGFDTVPLFFGVVAFSFESINVLLPVENKMARKEAMLGFGGVLNLSMVFSVSLFTAVAFYGYLCFGDSVQGSIIYSIPMSPWYVMIAKPMYALSIFISYALQFYIVFIIIWEHLESRLTTPRAKFWAEALLRVGIVTFSCVLAAAVPHIEHLISLIGAFAGSSLTLIFPALLSSIVLCKEKRHKAYFPFVIGKNAAIMLFGVLGAIVGTYTSIIAIIDAFGKE